MMIIEMREALLDKALDQLDEAKKYGKKCKLAMCELEDTLYECYESSNDTEDENYEDREEFDIPSEGMGDEEGEFEINYRGRNSRSARRNAMRMRYRDDDDTMHGSWRRRSMRKAMRRSRY